MARAVSNPTRLQPQDSGDELPPNTEDLPQDISSKICSGQFPEYVVTHSGHSQYSQRGGGVSACGLAALNCARIVLGVHAAGLGTTQLVQELMKRPFLEGVLKPCLSWENSTHLAVDEIHKAPVFEKSLQLVSTSYGTASYAFFRKLLGDVAELTKQRNASVCVIITRPPEIIACFSIADATSELFVIFDSHPRPDKHPDGAAFIFYNSVKATARYLTELLRFDQQILREADVQWQAQLLSHCSGDIFLSSDAALDGAQWAEAALQASLQALSAQAQVRDLQTTVRKLENDKKRLAGEVSSLEHDLLQMDDLLQKEQAKVERYKQRYSQWSRDASPWSSTSHQPPPPQNSGYGLWSGWRQYVPTPWSTTSQPRSSSPHEDRYGSRGGRQQAVPGAWPGSLGSGASADSEWRTATRRNGKQTAHGRMEPDPKPEEPEFDPVALQLQREYDEENRALEQERAALQRIQPKFFDCGICFEQYQEDDIARVHPCGHVYCRFCLRDYAVSKIEEHRYPILCPQCTADKTRTDAPGEIDDQAVQQLGLTEKQYEIYVEMQMMKFSTMIDCRKCAGTAFVDKKEYEESKIIHCPLKGCGYVWCKLCSQEVNPAVPEHSCDGTNELDHLMDQKGWKHCPGCHTPAEKTSGCNHISCVAPGCNSHFCYHCGQLFVRSALPAEIVAAKAAHYKTCKI